MISVSGDMHTLQQPSQKSHGQVSATGSFPALMHRSGRSDMEKAARLLPDAPLPQSISNGSMHDRPLPSPALSPVASPASSIVSVESDIGKHGLRDLDTPPISRTPSPAGMLSSNPASIVTAFVRPRKRVRKPILPFRALRSNDRAPGLLFKFQSASPKNTQIDIIKEPTDYMGSDQESNTVQKMNEMSGHSRNYLPTTGESNYLDEKRIRRKHRYRFKKPILDKFDEELLLSLGIDGFPTSEQFFSSFARNPSRRHSAAEALGFRSIGDRRFRVPSFARGFGSSDEEDEEGYMTCDSFEDSEFMYGAFPKKKKKKDISRKPRPVKTARQFASGDKSCTSCHTNQTPIWREVKEQWGDGWEEVILCNACGLQWRMAGLRCSNCSYVPRASEKREKTCPRCQVGHWKK